MRYSSLSAVRGVIDNINLQLCKLVSWFTLFMVVLTFLIVLLRYGFNVGWIAMQESVMYLHSMVFLLGAAHTLRVNEHVRVDIFYRQMTEADRRKVDIVGAILFLLPVNLFVFFVCFDYVADSWALFETSPEAGGLPLVFLLKSLLLLFATIMTMQGVAEILHNLIPEKSNHTTQGEA